MLKRLAAVLSLAVSVLSPVAAFSDGSGNFARNGFVPSENNAPDSYSRIPDPTGAAPSARVNSFTVGPGYCSQKKYDDLVSSDCKQQSVRSMLIEDVWKYAVMTQPKEQWYGWYMYIGDDFPIGPDQVKGQYMFAQFHNGQCPHLAFVNQTTEDTNLYLVTNRALGDYECAQDQKLKVLDLKDVRGRWVRFEMFVRWDDTDGVTQVFVDGEKRAEFTGRNLTIGYKRINSFHYGIYLCCTPGVDKVQTGTALFANVSSARRRERLK